MNISHEMALDAARAMVQLGQKHKAEGKDLPSRTDEARAGLEAALEGYIIIQRAADGVVDEILRPYRKMISDTPELLSLLYDIDMLPEQTVTTHGAIRLAAMCEVWKRGQTLPSQDVGGGK